MAKLIQYNGSVLLVCIFCFSLYQMQAQNNCRLIIHPVNADTTSISSLNLQQYFKDKAACIQYVNRLPVLLAVKGYASASVDSLWEDSATVFVRLFTGNK